MATYSSNTTVKVNAAVSGTATQPIAGSTSLYTAPATGYAIVQVSVTAYTAGGSVHNIQVGGRNVLTFTAVTTGLTGPIYVGPSQAVLLLITGGAGSATAVVSGVEFTNTP